MACGRGIPPPKSPVFGCKVHCGTHVNDQSAELTFDAIVK
ncbi:Uncharacterised protein [Serratia fonticola]|nr:Uncharacterised protein [Serratia fonticola]